VEVGNNLSFLRSTSHNENAAVMAPFRLIVRLF